MIRTLQRLKQVNHTCQKVRADVATVSSFKYMSTSASSERCVVRAHGWLRPSSLMACGTGGAGSVSTAGPDGGLRLL